MVRLPLGPQETCGPGGRRTHVAEGQERCDLRSWGRRRRCSGAAFAREGATVFLTGRNRSHVEVAAAAIAAEGRVAEVAQVDALDEQAVERHASETADKAGGIDISFNAIGIPQQGIQGVPLSELSLESFALPIATYTQAHFLTSRAAARRMVKKGSGVILMHTPGRLGWGRLSSAAWGRPGPRWKGCPAALSAEFASHGVRAVSPALDGNS